MKTPPPLVSFSSIEHYISSLDFEVRENERERILFLFANNLPPIVSARALGALFGFRAQFIGAMQRSPSKYYRTFTIKKGKKNRLINSPVVGLKVIQKWLGYYLSQAVEFRSHVIGFVPGRSTFDGAKIHCGSDWILSMDITDFFQSTPKSSLLLPLEILGYTTHAASLIADLSCLGGFLAQGSPLSPVLSNLAFQNTDEFILAYSISKGLNYTRYADDITISGTGTPPTDLIDSISRIVQTGPWRISEKKTRLSLRPYRLKVYGLLVSGEAPRLTKGYRKRIRSIKHLINNNKMPTERSEEAMGHLSYANSITKAKDLFLSNGQREQ